jgi:amidase
MGLRYSMVLAAGLTFAWSSPGAAADGFCVAEASLDTLRTALDRGAVTSLALVDAYEARIAALDRAGPSLNAVRTLNPDAAALAAARDDARARGDKPLGPLDGIPVLIKDNIATGDRQPTTAGSLALAGALARRDAFVVERLRRAGAIILGKTNLSEFANFIAFDMPSGYSSLGGQVLNPYAPALDEAGLPVVDPGGSSSGSGVAAAASLAAVTVGTETSGSLLDPASDNGIVTVKPTLGLISRSGIVPIAASQDTAGPMARSVRDAAILLGVLAGIDPQDPATRASAGHLVKDYTRLLDANALRGARIGVPRDPNDKTNDVFFAQLDAGQKAIMDNAIASLKAEGAVIVEAAIPTAGAIDAGTGTSLDVAVTNPHSDSNGKTEPFPAVLLYEFKPGLNAYLKTYEPDAPVHSLADIIAFNGRTGAAALRFGQDVLQASQATRGDLAEPAYRAARRLDIANSRSHGIDAYLRRYRLDAILFPGAFGADIAARAGYPSVAVPAGFMTAIKDKPVPPAPFGIAFTGPAFSEQHLLALAYAFEQATKLRRPPPLETGCAPKP